MRRRVAILLTAGFLVVSTLALAGGTTGATLAPTTTCSNGVDNTGGLGLICEVTVINTITAGGGTAVVTVRECHGAAGNPSAACTTTTSSLTGPVTVVNQCNDAINGGGGTLRCSVQVTNNFTGVAPSPTGATVNQCVGSGGGITTGCSPFPATTSGAAITQCNGSANGGTLVGLTCTATGTMAAGAGVTVNQCNGSANGGGSLVICSATISNATGVAPTPTPTPAASASVAPSAIPSATVAPSAGPVTRPTAGPRITIPPTDVQVAAGPGSSGPPSLPLFGLLFLAVVGLTVRGIRLATRSR
jgi:hypothetical protein